MPTSRRRIRPNPSRAGVLLDSEVTASAGPIIQVVGYVLGYGLLFGAVILRGATLREHAWGTYLALGLNLIPSAVLIRWLYRSKRPVTTALAAITSNTSGLIGFFAISYMQVGLSGQHGPISLDTALYFSIVTWTTLGYGDLQPTESLRLFAASEALIGYLYLSLPVAILAKTLKL